MRKPANLVGSQAPLIESAQPAWLGPAQRRLGPCSHLGTGCSLDVSPSLPPSGYSCQWAGSYLMIVDLPFGAGKSNLVQIFTCLVDFAFYIGICYAYSYRLYYAHTILRLPGCSWREAGSSLIYLRLWLFILQQAQSIFAQPRRLPFPGDLMDNYSTGEATVRDIRRVYL